MVEQAWLRANVLAEPRKGRVKSLRHGDMGAFDDPEGQMETYTQIPKNGPLEGQ